MVTTGGQLHQSLIKLARILAPVHPQFFKGIMGFKIIAAIEIINPFLK
jgi:hypothetical protein